MLYLKRNRGIFKNFTLTWLTPILFFLFGASPIGSLLTPSFDKIQSLISVALNSSITFLVRAVFFTSPHEENIYRLRDRLTECFCVRQGAGTTVLCKPAFRFSQFYLSKAVFINIIRSPRFIPSPCVILSLWSAPSPCFIPSPQSVVRSPQSIFYTD